MQQLCFLCQSCALHTVHTGRVDMISIFVIISKNVSITNSKICASSLPLREKTIHVRKNQRTFFFLVQSLLRDQRQKFMNMWQKVMSGLAQIAKAHEKKFFLVGVCHEIFHLQFMILAQLTMQLDSMVSCKNVEVLENSNIK